MNYYSKESVLKLETKVKNEKTVVSDSYFTPPFKLLKPFYGENNIMRLCVLNVSPGILEGDDYSITVNMGKGSILELYSQAYSKIFKMNTGFATQKVNINMEENCTLAYMLKPTMPYEHSDFRGETDIRLSKNCNLIFREIISCGRYKRNEVFSFKSFKSRTRIFFDGKLIFMDNTVLKPSEQKLNSMGLYGQFTHQANMIIVNKNINEKFKTSLEELLCEYEDIDFGVSISFKFGIIVRILGNGSEKLIDITDKLYNKAFDRLQQHNV